MYSALRFLLFTIIIDVSITLKRTTNVLFYFLVVTFVSNSMLNLDSVPVFMKP